MKIKESLGERIFNIFNICFMCILMVLTIYPILYVVFASLSRAGDLMRHTGLLFRPAGFSTAAYSNVFNNPMIASGYKNTIIVVVGGVIINMILTVMGAYFLSRRDQVITKYAMIFIIITMFFSGGMIPNYLNVRSFKLDNTLWSLILPTALSTFNLIIMRTTFLSIPDSLEESAKLDGANHFVILTRIFLPLSQATIAVLVLYYGVSHWNSWFGAMMYIRDRSLYPLQLILREILIANDVSAISAVGTDTEMVAETIKYAVIIIATLPILCLYPFLQKYFVKGVMVGAVKG